jgi:hypothetical protein
MRNQGNGIFTEIWGEKLKVDENEERFGGYLTVFVF